MGRRTHTRVARALADASPRTGRKPSKAPAPGISSPASGSSHAGSQAIAIQRKLLSRALRLQVLSSLRVRRSVCCSTQVRSPLTRGVHHHGRKCELRGGLGVASLERANASGLTNPGVVCETPISSPARAATRLNCFKRPIIAGPFTFTGTRRKTSQESRTQHARRLVKELS